ncbi:MAG: DUF418 domain-containing protein [Pseudomonadota bacterium]
MRRYDEDTASAGRQVLPDLVRAWALFGICVVNVGVLAYPMASSYHGGGLGTSADTAAFFLVNALFMMKSYSLFSFMFGVGFAYQIDSAERRGVGFAGRYWRRILGLLAFGILNIALFFFGDILVIYAVLGAGLFLMKGLDWKNLRLIAIILYIVQIVLIALFALAMWAGFTFAPEEMTEVTTKFTEMNKNAVAAFGEGTFVEAMMFRLITYAESFSSMIMIQGVGAFSFFLFGLAAVKAGVISDPSAAIWRRARLIALPLGLLISGLGGYVTVQANGMIDPNMFWGMLLITIGSPFSSFGYIGLLAKWAEGSGGPIRNFFARGGTSSLTAYLMQNAILSFTFAGYGLGYFAKWPAAHAIGFAALVALFTIAFTSIWRLFFSRGPLEYILRGITYAGAGR